MTKFSLDKILISQFKIIIEPRDKNWSPNQIPAAFVEKKKK